MNHLVKVIVLVNLAVGQVCRFPHIDYLCIERGGNKKPYEHLPGVFRGGADICVPLVRLFFVEMTRPSIYNI